MVYSFFLLVLRFVRVRAVVRYDETPEILKNDPLQYALANGLNPQFLAMEGSRLLDESRKAGAVAGDEEGLGKSP